MNTNTQDLIKEFAPLPDKKDQYCIHCDGRGIILILSNNKQNPISKAMCPECISPENLEESQ